MNLPFTHDQFLDVFAAYNSALWPAAVVLWLATAGTIAWFATGRAAGRTLAALLVVHWLWSGAVYHLGYFTTINPAARWFGLAFILEAGLVAWFGLLRSPLQVRWGRDRGIRGGLATFFSVYALAYPWLTLATGLTWPRMPAFGVPCPTTLLTVGVLLSTDTTPRVVGIIPLAWCVVGGSAALMLGVVPDLALILAGAALLIDVVAPGVLFRARAA